jgi:hypothetical protein
MDKVRLALNGHIHCQANCVRSLVARLGKVFVIRLLKHELIDFPA